eukprot:TRINITY_DN68417_c0_g1_i1.p1 TRINITY_DN68417_c0_g1~~TRINITY_DN68417_c0_g1_i1.p1  ORF type:complete len:388 (-),score=36.52 TRINITY_DN68417_c0_g1_i1:132-1295(-)
MGQSESSARRSKHARIKHDAWETSSASSDVSEQLESGLWDRQSVSSKSSSGVTASSATSNTGSAAGSFSSRSAAQLIAPTSAPNLASVEQQNKNTLQCRRSLTGHRNVIRCVVASDAFIITGSWDKKIKVWSLEDFSCVKTVDAHAGSVTGLCICGPFLFSCSEDKSIKKWDLQTGAELLTLKGHRDTVFFVFGIWDTLLVSGSADGSVRLWNTRNGMCDQTLEGHEGSVLCGTADCSDQRRTLIYTGSADRTIRVWHLETGEALDCWPDGEPGGVNSVVLAGPFLYSASGTFVTRWDKTNGTVLERLEHHSDRVYCLAVVGGMLFSGAKDSTLVCWNSQVTEDKRNLTGHRGGVLCIASAAQGKYAISGSMDCTIKVWELALVTSL